MTLDVAISRSSAYEVRATEQGRSRPGARHAQQTASHPAGAQKMTKTFTLSKDRADISATNGQQTRWAPDSTTR